MLGSLLGSYEFPLFEKFLFFLGFWILTIPVILSVAKARPVWGGWSLSKKFVSTLGFFVLLSLLIFPYPYPQGLWADPSGLSGFGREYGRMSLGLFDPGIHGGVKRRILAPALAHCLQFNGLTLYYLFSMLCVYVLIFMTLVFLDSKTSHGGGAAQSPGPALKFLLYASVMTTSYLSVSRQWPGYPEQVGFILILLMASLPMGSQARLALVALVLLTHDALAFVLAPLILFAFPAEERKAAFVVIALFFVLWLASYKFDYAAGFSAHLQRDAVAPWRVAMRNPPLTLAGLFFAHKLFWVLCFFTAARLWRRGDRKEAALILALVIVPIGTIFLAWDVSRLVGFGFLGSLIALAFFIRERSRLKKMHAVLLTGILLLNLCLVSYNVCLEYRDSLSLYRYPGLYQAIHLTARSAYKRLRSSLYN